MTVPLKVLVLGLDEKARNLFRMFFRGLCQNEAVIVDRESEADAFLIDLDTPHGAKLWARQRDDHPERILILLSVKDHESGNGAIFVKKPVEARNMIEAIQSVKDLAMPQSKKPKPFLSGSAPAQPKPPAGMEPPDRDAARIRPDSPAGREPMPPPRPAFGEASPFQPPEVGQSRAQDVKVVTRAFKDGASAHKVAMLLDEHGFKSYLGHRDDIDPADPDQLATVFYNPRVYLQGQIHAAIKVAIDQDKPIVLETPWKNITILPRHGLIQIQADEAQIRAACGIPLRNIVGADLDAGSFKEKVKLTALGKFDLEPILKSQDLVPLESFVWKVALFTSKGLLPREIDPEQAVFLKRWPGMTRLMLPPHAMRIAALLAQKPHSLFDAAKKLGIRQQYVFAFVSAAFALGLVGQQPLDQKPSARAEKPSPFARPERLSLFRKILNHLKFG